MRLYGNAGTKVYKCDLGLPAGVELISDLVEKSTPFPAYCLCVPYTRQAKAMAVLTNTQFSSTYPGSLLLVSRSVRTAGAPIRTWYVPVSGSG